MRMTTKMKIIRESSELAQGVFWIIDLDELNKNKNYCFPIYCTSDGVNIGDTSKLNAKSGITYNHEKLWSQLPQKLTHGKPYNYYPRGRVQINHGKAIIYLNPNIATEKVKQFLIQEFNLTARNGINKVVINVDGSHHYKCHLDN